MMRALTLCALAALPASAEEQVPAPAFFLDAVLATSTAQQLALFCPALSVDPVRVARLTDGVLADLNAAGFTPENLESRMEDPSEALAQRQQAFMERHALTDGAPTEVVCAAGLAEIAAQSDIGALLVEVTQ